MSLRAIPPEPYPPELPAAPPDRFQFHLKHLLAFMSACAVLAAGTGYALKALGRLPDMEATRLLNVVIVALAFGGLLYFFIRAPFLAFRTGQLTSRWRTIVSHRRAMDDWLKQHRERSKRIIKTDDKDSPPAGRELD